jgi:hypothetical protein
MVATTSRPDVLHRTRQEMAPSEAEAGSELFRAELNIVRHCAVKGLTDR